MEKYLDEQLYEALRQAVAEMGDDAAAAARLVLEHRWLREEMKRTGMVTL